jgi:hypothetical protein
MVVKTNETERLSIVIIFACNVAETDFEFSILQGEYLSNYVQRWE